MTCMPPAAVLLIGARGGRLWLDNGTARLTAVVGNRDRPNVIADVIEVGLAASNEALATAAVGVRSVTAAPEVAADAAAAAT